MYLVYTRLHSLFPYGAEQAFACGAKTQLKTEQKQFRPICSKERTTTVRAAAAVDWCANLGASGKYLYATGVAVCLADWLAGLWQRKARCTLQLVYDVVRTTAVREKKAHFVSWCLSESSYLQGDTAHFYSRLPPRGSSGYRRTSLELILEFEPHRGRFGEYICKKTIIVNRRERKAWVGAIRRESKG